MVNGCFARPNRNDRVNGLDRYGFGKKLGKERGMKVP
jgi:hypothetical protein